MQKKHLPNIHSSKGCVTMGIKINISWNFILLMDPKLDFQKEETLEASGSFHEKKKKSIDFKFIKMMAKKNVLRGLLLQMGQKESVNRTSLPEQGAAYSFIK